MMEPAKGIFSGNSGEPEWLEYHGQEGWGRGDRKRVAAGGRSPGYGLVFSAASQRFISHHSYDE